MVGGLAFWIAIVSLQVGNLRTLAPPYRVVFAVRVALGQLATVPFVIGVLPMTRRELSPRPIPMIMRPPEISFRVA